MKASGCLLLVAPLLPLATQAADEKNALPGNVPKPVVPPGTKPAPLRTPAADKPLPSAPQLRQLKPAGPTVLQAQRLDPNAAVVVNTPELALVGGARVDTSDRAAPAVIVNTPELQLTGNPWGMSPQKKN